MDRGSIKGQVRWNIISENGLQIDPVVVVANSILRYSEAWRCLDLAGIPVCEWYKMALWIKLETEPLIMYSIIDLAQAREGWRCHDRLSTPMYENM